MVPYCCMPVNFRTEFQIYDNLNESSRAQPHFMQGKKFFCIN